MDLEIIHKDILELLIEFDRLMKKNGIDYFLVGGTALGSVRHKGFIPWDDDADVGVLRKDFEKVEKILEKELNSNMKYYAVENLEKKRLPAGLLVNKKDERYGMDVFAIDNVPNNIFKRKIQNFFSLVYRVSVYRTAPVNRGKFNKIFITILLKIIPNKIWDIIMKHSKKLVVFWAEEETEMISNIFGSKGYWNEIMPLSYIKEKIEGEFEGHKFPIPKNYDAYLRFLYGDYMKLPPESERIPSHLNLK